MLLFIGEMLVQNHSTEKKKEIGRQMLFQAVIKTMETLNETELTKNELMKKNTFAHTVQTDSGIHCHGTKDLGTVFKVIRYLKG